MRVAPGVLLLATTGFQIEDSGLFLQRATWLLDQGCFLTGPPDNPVPDRERMYGYIVVLAGVKALFGASLWPIALISAMLDSLSACMIAAIERRVDRACGRLRARSARCGPIWCRIRRWYCRIRSRSSH